MRDACKVGALGAGSVEDVEGDERYAMKSCKVGMNVLKGF